MKKLVLLTAALCSFGVAKAQTCAGATDLFISEYVEGWGNNRAIEIYNPTPNAINLSAYSLGRFDNGSSALSAQTIVPLSGTIPSGGTYVLVVDLTDTTATGTNLAVWNGYQVMIPDVDNVTGVPFLGAQGEPLMRVKTYGPSGASKMCQEATYKPEWDLKGKANALICPVYAVNKTLYHNGNDAMALIKGTSVASPVIDAVGVIGDPTMTSAGGGTTWVNPALTPTNYLYTLTKDRTLVRKSTVVAGKVLLDSNGDTFNVADWDMFSENTFTKLGNHTCNCPLVATQNMNKIAFNVFPNPINRGMVTISGAEEVKGVEIHNALGQLVAKNTMNGNTTVQMNVGELTAGVYTMTVLFDNGFRTAKQVVVK